jgi:hypothetical protein
MKQLTDEEIQRLLEEGVSIAPSDDVVLYDKLFGELSKVPDFSTDNLKDKVVGTIYHRQESRSKFKTWVAVSIALIFGLLIFTAAALQVNSVLIMKVLQELVSYRWVVLFLAFVLIVASINRKTPVSHRD